MNKSYIEDSVRGILMQQKLIIEDSELDAIVESVLFDWNELGDPKADFEQLVEWNVDQYLSHNHTSGKELKRITRNEARKKKLKRFIQSEHPTYSKVQAKYFSMTDSNDDGWQAVEFWY